MNFMFYEIFSNGWSSSKEDICNFKVKKNFKHFLLHYFDFKGRVLLDPGWVSKYENSLNLNLIVPDGL